MCTIGCRRFSVPGTLISGLICAVERRHIASVGARLARDAGAANPGEIASSASRASLAPTRNSLATTVFGSMTLGPAPPLTHRHLHLHRTHRPVPLGVAA